MEGMLQSSCLYPSISRNKLKTITSSGRSFVIAGRGPTLDPSVETVNRCNALAPERGVELVGVCMCVRDM